MKLSDITFFTKSNETTAIEHLRVLAPLREAGINVHRYVFNDTFSFDDLIPSQLILIQRDFARDFRNYQKLLAYSRQNHIPLVLDLDDNLLDLPPIHPDRKSSYYATSLLPLLQTITDADAITVTTPELMTSLKALNQNIYLLPNFLDDKLWQFKSPKLASPDDSVNILYMGTHTHRADLEMISPAIIQILDEYPLAHFVSYGVELDDLLKKHKKASYVITKTMEYPDFADIFHDFDADIAVAPLVFNDFNEHKSPLKFFEYSANGIPGIYSNIRPYKGIVCHEVTGLLADNTLESWTENLKRLISDCQLRHQLALQAQEKIKSEHLLSQNSYRWVNTYEMIMDTAQAKKEDVLLPISTLEKINTQLDEYAQAKEKQVLILQDEKNKQQENIQSLESTINILKNDYENEIGALKNEHEKEIVVLKDQHKTETDKLINTHKAETDELINTHKTETNKLINMHENERDKLKQELESVHQQLQELYSSTSWKITSPIRKASRLLSSLKRKKLTSDTKSVIADSGLFDASYYLLQNPDIRDAKIDPLTHFINHGWKERRNPSAKFNIDRYLKQHPELIDLDVNPIIDYIQKGKPEFEPEHEEIDSSIPKHVEAVRSHQPVIPNLSHPLDTQNLKTFIEGLDSLLSQTKQNTGSQGKVSIVIPVYNHFEETLNCLKSLAIANDSPELEIIVIDDASSDLTQTVLQPLKNITYIRNEENLGFLHSCNKAAKEASGQYICFLNNDTMVMPGWLESILGTFKREPKAGLVGSKLYYPNGILQEVGGIIWRDANGLNYGRNDDPQRPEYCYLRETDYCSGAAIFLPLPLWHNLNGFDPHFAPAYYEDTDLAFRIREAGYKVFVQPLSKVIHFEGISSGTDLSSGAKHNQVINKEKFLTKWEAVLKDHKAPHAPQWHNVSHHEKPRFLVIDYLTPKPDLDSGSIDTYHYLLSLRKMGFDVVFYSARDSEVIDKYVTALQSQGIQCLYPPYVENLASYLEAYGKAFQYVMIFRAPIADMYMNAIKHHCPQAKVIFNTVDLHFLREKRAAALAGNESGVDHHSINKNEALEVGLMTKADLSILVSEYERSFLGELYPKLVTRVMPLPREIPGRKNGFDSRKDIAFVGGYLHAPNIDAIDYFVKEVWPLVGEKLPGVKFKVVGSNMPESFSQYASPSVELVGFVEDLGEVFDNVRLSVAPLRFGAGIKGKVVSSLSYGLPCVASSIAAEGMNLTDGENILQSDDPHIFANLIYKAYTDKALWTKLSDNGLSFVHDRHSLESFEARLKEIIAFLDKPKHTAA